MCVCVPVRERGKANPEPSPVLPPIVRASRFPLVPLVTPFDPLIHSETHSMSILRFLALS